jgi:hypothetical protein
MKNVDFEGNAVKTVERKKSRQLGLRSELFPISPGIDSFFIFFHVDFLILDQGLIKVEKQAGGKMRSF